MKRIELVNSIKQKKSYLCVGLDTDIEKIPDHLKGHPDAVFEFNKAIVDATKEVCVAYKINTAFYEVQGAKGWDAMQRTAEYIGTGHFKIADAKRGDIGNTSNQYAKAFFEMMPFDAITVAPYMGSDSVQPFLKYDGKWSIVLGLTSNKGAADFELQNCGNELLYEKILKTVSEWGCVENLMFVVGATQSDSFINIRKIIPDNFLLVPGVGAQGGSLREISEKAMNGDCSLLVNVSRDIIYASSAENFADAVWERARVYQNEMAEYLKQVL